MKSSSEQSTTIRRGRPGDVEAILNLLTEYGLPRSYFEPFYLNDSSYRPEHSWVVEQRGRLLSHLRVYDRWNRVDRAKLRIAEAWKKYVSVFENIYANRRIKRVPSTILDTCTCYLG